MNKLDFLRRLDRELSALDQTERRELLAFYEERFYNGTIYENKTEEQVVLELESPEVIAKNILSEYGISVKEAKKYGPESQIQSEYQNNNDELSNNNSSKDPGFSRNVNPNDINTSQLVWLIIVDVLVLSWVIPTLFSVLVSVSAGLLTYIGVLGFLSSTIVYDQMIFWFLTGAYIWLFLFVLVILDFFMWTIKSTIIWHMKVFRYKKVNEWNKKFAKVSVESWFKRHKFIKLTKNLTSIGALIVMAYTGYFLFSSYDEIRELYIEQDILTDVQKIDVADDITAEAAWDILGNLDSMDVEIKPTSGNEIIITRTYLDDSDATYTVEFDETENVAEVNHISPNQLFHFGFSIEKMFSLYRTDTVVIELPLDLFVESIQLESSNGTVDIDGVNAETVYIDGGNGKITLNDMEISGDATIKSSNANMDVKYVIGDGELFIQTSNGRISVSNTAFQTYILKSSNGRIGLSQLNNDLQDGVSLVAESSNGELEFTGVYVAKVTANTSNGDIDFHNEDLSFIVDYSGSTSNGSESVNVD